MIKKVLKVLAIACAALVGLAVIAAVAVVTLFDPNDYKGYVESYVKAQTGRDLELGENLDLTFFPWLAIETGGITLGNAPGFEAEPFATIEHAAVRVRLLPLLERKVELGTIVLEGLTLNLGVDREGHGNWEDLTARETEPPAGGGDQAATASSLESLDIEGLVLRDATIAWRENGDELRYVLRELSFTSGHIALGAPVNLKTSFELSDVETGRTLTLDLSGGLEIDAGGGVAAHDIEAEFGLADREAPKRATGHLELATLTIPADRRVETGTASLTTTLAGLETGPDPLALEASWTSAVLDSSAGTLAVDGFTTRADGIEAAWRLTAHDLFAEPALEGSVTISPAPLKDVLALLGVEPPAGTDPGSLGDVTLTTAFEAAPTTARVALSSLELHALGLELAGDARLADGKLDARLEAPAFTPSAGFASLLRGYLPSEIDTTAFDRLAFSGRIATTLGSSAFEVDRLRAELLGATLEGTVQAVAEQGGVVYRGTLKSSRFAPDAFAKAFHNWLTPVAPKELGTLAIDTKFVYDPARDTLALEPFAGEIFGLSGRGQLTVATLSSAPAITGRLAVERFGPRDLMRRFGATVPETSDPKALTSASITTRLTVNAESGRFEDVVLALDDSRITGNFTVDDFESPKYQFALAIDRVDADRYLPPSAAEADAGETTAGDIELPVETLEKLQLGGHVDVGHLGLAGLSFDQVKTDLALGGGSASLSNAHAALYGGTFDGGLGVDGRGKTPTLALHGKAANLALAPLIAALTGETANVSGTGSFDLSLTGQGAKVIDNVRTAAGNVSFALEKGAIDGFNLGRTLCAVYNSTQKIAQPARADAVTAFEAIRGTATVTNGVARSDDLLARTSFMDVTGKGSLGLAEQRLDYDLVAKLTGPIKISGCESMSSMVGDSIPLTLRGTLTSPDIRPDFSEILRQRLRDEARKSITNRLQQLLQPH